MLTRRQACGYPVPPGCDTCGVCGLRQPVAAFKWLHLVRRTILDHPAEKHVLRCLADHAWAGADDPELGRFDGECVVLRRTVARETGYPVVTVKRAIKGLVDKRIIERVSRGRRGGGRGANLYRILPSNGFEKGDQTGHCDPFDPVSFGAERGPNGSG